MKKYCISVKYVIHSVCDENLCLVSFRYIGDFVKNNIGFYIMKTHGQIKDFYIGGMV